MPTYRAYKIINMYTTRDIEAPNEGQARAIALNDLGAIDKIEELPPPPPPAPPEDGSDAIKLGKGAGENQADGQTPVT